MQAPSTEIVLLPKLVSRERFCTAAATDIEQADMQAVLAATH